MTSIALCLPAVFPMAGVPCKALATSQLSGSDLPRLLQPPVPRKLRQDEHLLSALWGSVPHRHLLWTPWGVAQLRSIRHRLTLYVAQEASRQENEVPKNPDSGGPEF
uniref:uncharacterized protein LOC100424277 isoform X4 n=1 Tax=Macaca mulatta TaxID=9544 RepID=UPI0010A265A5|nr:uncharacterized protein LOC100424277 isoform X4 [Macaca mulatta]XP_028692277.1 uncharacterized protein LOC100424277 isoform X4 [Macaca mulatta]